MLNHILQWLSAHRQHSRQQCHHDTRRGSSRRTRWRTQMVVPRHRLCPLPLCPTILNSHMYLEGLLALTSLTYLVNHAKLQLALARIHCSCVMVVIVAFMQHVTKFHNFLTRIVIGCANHAFNQDSAYLCSFHATKDGATVLCALSIPIRRAQKLHMKTVCVHARTSMHVDGDLCILQICHLSLRIWKSSSFAMHRTSAYGCLPVRNHSHTLRNFHRLCKTSGRNLV